MSAHDRPASTATKEPDVWTEEYLRAALASDYWFHVVAPPELKERYRGMHVAILGEQIIDADRDFNELSRRLDANCDTVPLTGLLLRYVPTDEEAVRFTS